MIVSQARILASQANGKLSKGPVTPEGKRISRANSLKHGMTGEGVVLLDEHAAEVSQRFEELQAQFHPATPMGKILVHRIALTSVRLERCAEQEAAHLSEKIRHAREDHDEQRQFEVAALLDNLAKQPSASVNKLLRTPEGTDALILSWQCLREDLARPSLKFWTPEHNERAHLLTGRKVAEIPISRIQELSTAIWGDFDLLPAHEGAGLDVDARRAWARDRLIEWIDDEMATLRECREGLDLEAFELDREQAPTRALFDASKPAVLARRYEAATERAMYKALKDLRQVESDAAKDPQASAAYPIKPLGSFFPASEPSIEPGLEAELESEAASDDEMPATSRSDRGEFAAETAPMDGREGSSPRGPSAN